MIKHFWPVIQADERHGCRDSRCCYCGERLGAEHQPKCSVRQRTVMVELDQEIELIAWFPEAWPLPLVDEYCKGRIHLDLTFLFPDLGEQQAASQCMLVTNIREATDEDEERLPEWPAW